MDTGYDGLRPSVSPAHRRERQEVVTCEAVALCVPELHADRLRSADRLPNSGGECMIRGSPVASTVHMLVKYA
ncbi:MAG TPA: hypothetical protein VGK74_02300 [Symbiobacteriaceae bacterium]